MKIALLSILLCATLYPQTPQIFTLRNKAGMEAKITNYGGTLMSLKVPDRAGKLDDVVLGFDTPEEYITKKDHPYFGALVGRYGNKLAKPNSASMAKPTSLRLIMEPTHCMAALLGLTEDSGSQGRMGIL